MIFVSILSNGEHIYAASRAMRAILESDALARDASTCIVSRVNVLERL